MAKRVMAETIVAIDWTALRAQKGTLASVIVEVGMDGSQERVDALSGILHLIDALQDAAVADGIATEKEVFGLPRGV